MALWLQLALCGLGLIGCGYWAWRLINAPPNYEDCTISKDNLRSTQMRRALKRRSHIRRGHRWLIEP